MLSVKWTPHGGQRLGLRFLLEHAAGGLFADPGVGKTSATLAAFKLLKKRGMADKMLVIAPLRPCYLVWGPEVQKWKDFADLKVEILHGPDKDEALHRDADIYVMNPNGLDWIMGAETFETSRGKTGVTIDLETFRSFGFDTLCLDELTLWKNTSSVRHKTIKQALGTFSRRWGLTGTPAPNGLIDLFGQCYMLDMGATFGPYITHFRNKYFVPGYDGFSYHLQSGAAEKIYAALKPLVLRLDAKDYIDMPDLIENVIEVELPPAAQKIYKTLEDEMITQIGTKEVKAVNAASLSTKCRQIVNGGIYVSDTMALPSLNKAVQRAHGREWVEVHKAKTDALVELFEELQGQPLLVAYDFNHDLVRLQETFSKLLDCPPKDVPYIGAGVSPKRAQQLEKEWNLGNLPILFGHPASIGHGLNLQQSSNHLCWYGLTWNRELFDQFNGRIARQGSKYAKVFAHIILARGTIDSKIYYALHNKDKTQNALLEALKDIKRVRKTR